MEKRDLCDLTLLGSDRIKMEIENLKGAVMDQKIELKKFSKRESPKNHVVVQEKHVTTQPTRGSLARGSPDPHFDENFDSIDFKMRLIYDGFLTFVSKSKKEIKDWKYFLLTEKMLEYSSKVLITALILFKRYINVSSDTKCTIACFIKAFLGCILLASKCLDDFSFYGEDIMNNWNSDPKSICKIEIDILTALNFNVSIKDSEYKWVICQIKKVNKV